MTETTLWGMLCDRKLSFPLDAAEVNVATLMFEVPVAAARALVPGTAFEVVEIAAGRAQFIVAACDYLRTAWGACREMTFAFLVRPAGAPAEAPGLFGYRMPVDEAFTCAVGNGVMGYPVSVELIQARYTTDEVTFGLAVGVQRALELRIPRGGRRAPGGRFSMVSYSYRDGVPYAMPMEMDVAPRTATGSVGVTLGTGPLADELRGLGLPREPDSCSWGEGLTATFHIGRPVRPAVASRARSGVLGQRDLQAGQPT
ncbi:hypothetical protein ACRYCC_41285 [Actinomadura scrupuli]|uniref:hypothetical protein n=1 Tax=Actinomadura scrupuli TaxID=559629 RepID=UPI003D9725D8